MSSHLEIFIFIDALGWDIAQSHHFLQELLPYRAPAQMQFGYSCTAVPTILTGVYPETHGHLSFFFKAKDKSPFRFFKYLAPFLKPDSLWRRGRVRNWVSKILKAMLGYTGYFQIYSIPFAKLPYMDYCEKQDLFVQNGLAPVPNLRDELIKAEINFTMSDWHKPELFNLQEAQNAASDPNMQFIFTYTAGFDSLLHFNVNNGDAIAKHLAFYQEHIQKIAENSAKSHDSFSLTIFSDHGMTPLNGTYDLEAAMKQAGLKFGKDYISCIDSTMARFWFNDNKTRDTLFAITKNAPGHWLTKQEMKYYGILFPDDKFGQDIMLMNPGTQIIPSDMGIKPLPGMHGFLPEDKNSLASVLSNTDFSKIRIHEVADYFKLMKARINTLAAYKQ